jgi:hypothetical protein
MFSSERSPSPSAASLVVHRAQRAVARMQGIGYPGSLIGKTGTLEADFGGRINVILVPETLGF